jgi:hypothetical protein
MDKPRENKLQKASKKLRESLTLEKIRKIPKYRNINMAQYLELISKIENLAILLLEAYIFTQNNTS